MHKEHHMEKPDLRKICELEKCMIDALSEELPIAIKMQGEGNASVGIYGEVVDMIKDLAETKKYCMEAYYYEHVVKDMEEYEREDEEEDSMGYDKRRYPSSGRFAPKGKGVYRSYIPAHILDDRIFPPDMRYMDENMAMEYKEDGHSKIPSRGGSSSGGRYGYSYDEYQHAKTSGDKAGMENKAVEHMTGMLGTIREVWKDSDPALKKRLKSELTAFVNNEMMV